MYFLERDLQLPMPAIRNVDSIVAREGTIDDLPLLSAVQNPERARREAQERLQRGDRWFIAVERTTGKLTNYRWVSLSRAYIPELNRDIVVQPGQAYVYDLETLPEFRRRGIEAVTRQFTYDSLLRQYGISRIVVYIRADNRPSLQAGRQYLTAISRVWFACVNGVVYVYSKPNERMPALRPASHDRPAQAAFLARGSSSLR